jgi:hypothetical protein
LNPVRVRIGVSKALEKRCEDKEHGSSYEKVNERFPDESLQQRGPAATRHRAPMDIWPGARNSDGVNREIELLSY